MDLPSKQGHWQICKNCGSLAHSRLNRCTAELENLDRVHQDPVADSTDESSPDRVPAVRDVDGTDEERSEDREGEMDRVVASLEAYSDRTSLRLHYTGIEVTDSIFNSSRRMRLILKYTHPLK
ncbi:uncharacterized protein EDB93DRAFT_1105452 [Suillus bovinus]|uniref:uncharacterized protein n=1 Tax=Suillus bovinus TaxID=48563 RepID=UPI001B8607B0|nr:uncharacterized protein EDB93DRAFT_1105452 [Suillus bovinus]KAG2142788.1 hypothetical protein EDB93DRAFT_1105452 [Suillus bovinus]